MADKKRTKRINLAKKRKRVKSRLKIGTFPRLVVYRANSNIYAQIIDDINGVTLVSASSLEATMKDEFAKAESKISVSSIVGKAIGEKAIANKIEQVIFDRNGYKYHGRVKALAEAARKTGLRF
jgi:large subunit ribosomal protein L18